MNDLLGLLGFKVDIDSEYYQNSGNLPVSISSCKEYVLKYNPTISPEEIDTVARNVATTKAFFLSIAKDIYDEFINKGHNEDYAKSQVLEFFQNHINKISNETSLLFLILQLLIDNYTQYVSDRKIDLDKISSYYSNNPKAYAEPYQWSATIYNFDNNTEVEKEKIREFTKGIKDKVATIEHLEKFKQYAREEAKISSLFVINGSSVEQFYNKIKSLEVGQISDPIVQSLGDRKNVFFVHIVDKEKLPNESKKDQLNLQMLACRFIAMKIVQDYLEQLIKNKQIIE